MSSESTTPLIERYSKDIIIEVALKSVEYEKGNRIIPYNLFKWWSRRFSLLSRILLASLVLDREEQLYDVLSGKVPEYIYYKTKNKTIYDPFMGGGTILIEALKLGYDVIGIDINPVAVKITDATIRAIDCSVCGKISICLKNSLIATYNAIRKLWMYDNNMIVHVFASRCPPCKAPIWISSKRGNRGIKEYILIDKYSGDIIRVSSKDLIKYYDKITPIVPAIDLRPFLYKLPMIAKNVWAYAVEVYDTISKKRRFISLISDREESKRLIYFLEKTANQARELLKKETCIHQSVPLLRETRRLIRNKINDLSLLFTWRQLATLITFIKQSSNECKLEASLVAGNTARTTSLLSMYYQPYSKVNPALVIKSYWLPSNPVELNPISFTMNNDYLKSIGRGTLATYVQRYINTCLSCIKKHNLLSRVSLKTADATKVKINKNTFAIVTDPPYPGYHKYTDLGLLYSYFLSLEGFLDMKRYINSDKDEINTLNRIEYIEKMKKIITNISILRKGSYVILILGASSTEGIRTISKIVEAFLNNFFGLRRIYWFPGESPGLLGRSISRSIFVIVFRKNYPTLGSSIQPLRYSEYVLNELLSSNVLNISIDIERKLIEELYLEIEKVITHNLK